MASTLVKLYVHIIFHVKTTGITLLEEDLPHIFSYMGGRGTWNANFKLFKQLDCCLTV